MTVRLVEFLGDVRETVDLRLRSLLDDLPADPLRDAMAYSVFNGGKRIRPALCYAAADIFGTAGELTHRAAAALELIHAYSLIHDDLPAMDNDDLRRGKPTCHIAFGEAIAILAGDALQTLAFEILASPSIDSDRQVQLLRVLARAGGARGMVLGQSRDLAAVDRSLDYSALESMHRHKTGALIAASIEMGALSVARVTTPDRVALEAYGAAIGLAFQIKDDLLDVESSTEALGKTQGTDRAHNKPTYPSLLGLEGAKQKLHQLHRAAQDAAAQFGDRGELLCAIADFTVRRTH